MDCLTQCCDTHNPGPTAYDATVSANNEHSYVTLWGRKSHTQCFKDGTPLLSRLKFTFHLTAGKSWQCFCFITLGVFISHQTKKCSSTWATWCIILQPKQQESDVCVVPVAVQRVQLLNRILHNEEFSHPDNQYWICSSASIEGEAYAVRWTQGWWFNPHLSLRRSDLGFDVLVSIYSSREVHVGLAQNTNYSVQVNQNQEAEQLFCNGSFVYLIWTITE